MPQRDYTLAEIVSMLGLSTKKKLRAEIRAGRLKAFLDPRRRPSKRWLVPHEQLARWLTVNGFPLKQFRYLLSPGDAVLAVGLTGPQLAALGEFRVVPASNLFRLGQLSRDHPAWAIIVSFPAVGRDLAMAAIGEFAREYGRPYLVGLVSDDEATRPGRAADVFDVLYPASSPPPVIAGAIRRLRKWGDTRT